MEKTITLRIDDDTYTLIKKAADGQRRSISNFIEFATVSYLTEDSYISDEEMNEIIMDKELIKNIGAAKKDIKDRKYRIVE